jgi:Lrp/AsnC family transcriptional regulator, regulator for asnA, asnC and gidA
MIDLIPGAAMEQTQCQIDDTDREILRILQGDARASYLEIARKLGVSGGTIHARLGYSVSAFIGLKLVRAHDCGTLMAKLDTLPEVLEVHYTTGAYSLFIKVIAKSMQDLHRILFDRLQGFDEIQSTETFIILDTSLDRQLAL